MAVRHLLSLQATSSPGLKSSDSEEEPTSNTCPSPRINSLSSSCDTKDSRDGAINKTNTKSDKTAPGLCTMKVSSSTCSYPYSDDERATVDSNISSSPPQKSCSPDQKTCCGHNGNDKTNNNQHEAHSFPHSDTPFINGFTECLRLVKSSLKANTVPPQNSAAPPPKVFSSNLEETLESYLSELQDHILRRKPHNHENYLQNNNSSVVDTEDYFPQHSPGSRSTTSTCSGSSFGGYQDSHGMETVDSPGSYENINKMYANIQGYSNSASLSSPVLISKRFPRQYGEASGQQMSTVGTHPGTRGGFVVNQFANGESSFVMETDFEEISPRSSYKGYNSPSQQTVYTPFQHNQLRSQYMGQGETTQYDNQQQHLELSPKRKHYIKAEAMSAALDMVMPLSTQHHFNPHQHFCHSIQYFAEDRTVWRPW